MAANIHSGIAELAHSGILHASGADARTFLHAQLTIDIEHLADGQARYAGWCSAKGRLLASFLVVPCGDGYLLQVSRDIAASVAKRLSMFVLRAKVRIADASDAWTQYGIWGPDASAVLARAALPAPAALFGCATQDGAIVTAVEPGRYLVFARAPIPALAANAQEDGWRLAEIRAGRPAITLATQDQFVPQMANFEVLGGVDFKKGCYPGQEIVARTQYRGILKRRMYRVRAGTPLHPGQDLYSGDAGDQASGTVLNAVDGEALAVLQIGAVNDGTALRAAPGGAPLEVLPLPYAP